MIIVKLMGGLGNQMFQYAAGKSLAIRLGTNLKLDISGYKRDTLRNYSLDCFVLKADFATDKEILKYNKNMIGFPFFFKYNTLKEFPAPNFVPQFFTIQGNVFLDGYWQSETYFKNIRKILLADFEFSSHMYYSYSEKIRNNNSVSLHIRRGDYISNEATNKFHGTCDLNYYTKAVNYINSLVKNPYYYIFSDDLDWCKKNINKIFNGQLVSFIKNSEDSVDLQLMMQCKNSIIANSSFSWWGAWLNSNPKNITIAPQKWFQSTDLNQSHILPENWIKL